jgi:Ca2+-binding RTX toxin-like protein
MDMTVQTPFIFKEDINMAINGTQFNDNNTVNGDGLFHTELVGTSGNDIINGLAGDDILKGLAGNDTLDGGSGADRMLGGLNDDVYFVDNIFDQVTENANEGTDTIKAFDSYTMPNNVEILFLQGTADISGFGNNQNNITLLGNIGNNYLKGGTGINVLNGMAGSDTLEGGLGDDFYIVDNPGDKIVEAPGTGIETVLSFVNWDLRVSFKPGNPSQKNDPGVEGLDHLTLVGNAKINGTGNKLDNTIKGNGSGNLLSGLGGKDTLYGFGGADTLLGDGGDDVLVGYNGALNEVDILVGGSGADTFVLGDANQMGYGGDGDGGLAYILDFNFMEQDKIRVQGSFEDYRLENAFKPGVGSDDLADTLVFRGNELVAIVADRSGFQVDVRLDFDPV